MDERIKYIDIAKGISILLVALFHSKVTAYIPDVIAAMSLFRMPLFFFLSGVFFSYAENPKEFFIKKTEALLKPYFAVLLLLFFVDVTRGSESVLLNLAGLFYGNATTIKWQPLWFLTHLFAIYVFTYTLFNVLRFSQLSLFFKCAVLLTFISVGSYYINHFWNMEINIFGQEILLPGLPFSVDIILVTSVYFIAGHLLRFKLIEFTPNIYIALMAAVIFLCISINTDAHKDLALRIYNEPFFATLGTFCGIYLVISLAWLLANMGVVNDLLSYVGNASLYILIFHYFFQKNIYEAVSSQLNLSTEPALLSLAIISFAASIIFPLLIRWMVIRSDFLSLAFLPFRSNKLVHRALAAIRS